MMNALAEKGNILDHFHTSRFKLSLRVHCSPARQSHNMSLHPGARPRQRPSRGPSMVMSKDDSIMDLRSRSLNEPSGHLSSGGLSQPVGAAIWSQLQAGLRAILPTNRETSWAAAEHVTSSSITEKQQAKPASRVTPRDREILALLVPAMLAVFLDPSMGAIDLAFIGRVGTAPLAAVGLSNLIFFFATVFFSFLIVVITPAVASAIAKDDKREASLIIAQSTWIAGVCGVALTAGVFFGAPWLIQRFGPSAEVASLAIAHLRIRAFACPAQLLLHVANGAYRGFRDTRTPLYAGAAQNAVNLLLDSLLVVSLSCSVVGAATAGTVGLSVGALAMFSMLLKNGQLDPADFSRVPGLAAIGRTLAPGIPLGFCIFAVMMSVLTATNGATALGATALAAHTINKQIIDYAMFIFGAFSTTAQSLIASSLGKGDKEEGRAYLKRLTELGSTVGLTIAAIILLGRHRLPFLFTNEEVVVQTVAQILPIIGFLMPLAPIAMALEGTLLGAMQIRWVGARTIASAAVSVGFQLWAQKAGWGLSGVWVGLVVLVVMNAVLDGLKVLFISSPLAESGPASSPKLLASEKDPLILDRSDP